LSPGKDGEADDVFFIVDTAGCSQADNSGCLDPTVNKTVQEKGPLEARSNFPTEPSTYCLISSTLLSEISLTWILSKLAYAPA